MVVPYDTWIIIFQYLSTKEVFGGISLVCNSFRDMIEDQDTRGRLPLSIRIDRQLTPKLIKGIERYQFKHLALGGSVTIPSLDQVSDEALNRIRSISLFGDQSQEQSKSLDFLDKLSLDSLSIGDSNVIKLVSKSFRCLKELSLENLHYPLPVEYIGSMVHLRKLIVSERIRYTVWDEWGRGDLMTMIISTRNTLQKLNMKLDKASLPKLFNDLAREMVVLDELHIEIANTIGTTSWEEEPYSFNNLTSLHLNCATKDIYWLCQTDMPNLKHLSVVTYFGLHSTALKLPKLESVVRFPMLQSLSVTSPKEQMNFLFAHIPTNLTSIRINTTIPGKFLLKFDRLRVICLSSTSSINQIISNNSGSIERLETTFDLTQSTVDLLINCPNFSSLKICYRSGLVERRSALPVDSKVS